jgi:putative salt-induced outer membrane protein YdiY
LFSTLDLKIADRCVLLIFSFEHIKGGDVMKDLKGILLGILVALPFAAMAEDTTTNVTWKSSLALGATYKDGNTEKSLFTGTLKGDRFAPMSDWLNSLYTEYGKTEGDQTEGQARAQSDYRYKFGGKNLFGGVFGEAYYDDIKNIRTRLKIGPNIGYYFINREAVKFDVSFGINYVYERTSTTEEDFAEYRVAANYLRDLTETADYYLNVEYSANVEDTDDGNGLLVTGLKAQVQENLSMFIELRDEYDNTPAIVDTETGDRADYNDITIVAGLMYDF